MYKPVRMSYVCLLATVTLFCSILHAQTDPGPRPVPNPLPSPSPFSTLDTTEKAFFTASFVRFQEVDSVSGSLPGETGSGLGPTFNANSCASCHAFPSIGGSSPKNNPQIAFATLDRVAGGNQQVPSFITANGPVREARFILNSNGSLDGGVHGLYTIAGRTDAPGCTLAQPNFAAQLANNNVIFRIPTPLLGLGLVENTSDLELEANLATNASQKAALGISGMLNTSANDGTVTKFGWKAQNKSLIIFAGEAYNVEQGVSNEVFPNERSAVAGCVFNATPEDSTNLVNTTNSGSPASDFSSDVINFAAFMRLTAPPAPIALSASAQTGQNLFNSIGCVLCHSSSLTTAASPFTGMSNVTYAPYSDFALHHMGSVLADGISQGNAGPDQFRTAPLWGVGQRLFLLHDGRTSNLLQAIEAHAGSGSSLDTVTIQDFEQFNANGQWFQPDTQTQTTASEAEAVIKNFNALSSAQQQDILNFLRSL